MTHEDEALRVCLVNRAPGKFHSIEELFTTISKSFPDWVESKVATAPCSRATLTSIVTNLRWFRALGQCDLIHQTGDIHYTVLGQWSIPVVLTILDLRFVEENRGLKRLLLWLLWVVLPCFRADRISVISEFTKQRLVALAKVPPRKIQVIPCCVGTEFRPVTKAWNSKKPCLLLVGTTSNKNLGRVVEACRGLSVSLKIIGELDSLQRSKLDSNCIDFQELHGLSRTDIVQQYAECDAVIFVSTYEGFGIPILEGQAVGRPVITSNISPMCNVAGEGALTVDPLDVCSIRAGLERLLGDAALRQELVRKGFQNVAGYTSEVVAGQYAALYREVLKSR